MKVLIRHHFFSGHASPPAKELRGRVRGTAAGLALVMGVVMTQAGATDAAAEPRWFDPVGPVRIDGSVAVDTMRRLQDVRVRVAQVENASRGDEMAQTPVAEPSQQGGKGEGTSPTRKSSSVKGRFPGADVTVEPKDMTGRPGGMPLDVPRELDVGRDDREQAILQRQQVLNRFNPALGLVIEAVGGYTQRRQRRVGGDGADANGMVGTRFPPNWHANLRTLELFASAEVDPFARAYVVVGGHAESVDDRTGSAEFGKAVFHIEEAVIQTTSLPYNLSIRGGRFFGEFGYLARRHSHDLPQIDRPPSLAQLFSEAQVDGVEIAWLAPLPFYLQLSAAYGSRFGEVVEDPLSAFRQHPIQGNTVLGKVTLYHDLNDDNNVEVGLSAAYAPQSRALEGSGVLEGDSIDRHILALDYHYRWYPLGRGLRQSFSLHGEVFHDVGQGRRDVFGNTVRQQAWGGYLYGEYRFSKRWRTGFRFDYHQELTEPALVTNPLTGLTGSTVNQTGNRTDVRTYSPYVTFYPSEFQRFLLQYNRSDHGNASDNHQVLFQWEVVIGSHQHGFTERD